ncbi:META domain-containing protein [Nocardioides sp. HM23]|uniref:META domain-containing protein n=1 Tax=Nocardioides bizhenqiangii TaxID=3095076 RepID=UPI002ACA7CDB|nr:META domain-containing protein [Nocardioides sp. HM23]MDZ5620173.1 META domain-containing protein [Nocardioides sp. HM23]
MTPRPIGMRLTLLAATALLAVTLAGCGDEEPTTMADDAPAALSSDDLDGRAFSSVRVDGHQLVGDTRVRLGFSGEEVRAEAGCNHLFGTVAIDGGTLTASNMGGTEMGCPDGLHDQDSWLAAFLSAGPEAVLVDDTLTLSKDGVVIELVELDLPDAPTGDPDEPRSDDDGSVVSSG